MTSNQSLGILFFIRKERVSDDKLAAVYLRLTVNGKRAELSIKREVEITKWNSTGGCATGYSETSKQLNEYINLWKTKIYQAHKQLVEEEALLSAEAIKNILLGNTEKQKTIVEVFEYHNKMLGEKVNIDHAAGTHSKYITTLKHLNNFILEVYKKSDIILAQLNYKFITDFEHYLLTVAKIGINTTAKYIKNT